VAEDFVSLVVDCFMLSWSSNVAVVLVFAILIPNIIAMIPHDPPCVVWPGVVLIHH